MSRAVVDAARGYEWARGTTSAAKSNARWALIDAAERAGVYRWFQVDDILYRATIREFNRIDTKTVKNLTPETNA